ncbi:hypothetical protein B0H13DRAFT_1891269 [Mycena leptocephala]|nr:hypothetical protein B0H13DRAFT_1891269 [Mycena leptocephala]
MSIHDAPAAKMLTTSIGKLDHSTHGCAARIYSSMLLSGGRTVCGSYVWTCTTVSREYAKLEHQASIIPNGRRTQSTMYMISNVLNASGGCVRRAAYTSAMTGIFCRRKVSTEFVKFCSFAVVKMFEEQEAEKDGKVEGRSRCGGCEVEPWSSVNRKIWTAASQENGGCLRRYVADLAVVEIWSNQNYSELKVRAADGDLLGTLSSYREGYLRVSRVLPSNSNSNSSFSFDSCYSHPDVQVLVRTRVNVAQFGLSSIEVSNSYCWICNGLGERGLYIIPGTGYGPRSQTRIVESPNHDHH